MLSERRSAAADAQASYEEAAQHAERLRELARANGKAQVAAARVTVEYASGGVTFDVPVPVKVHSVPVTPLVNVDLDATRATDSWDTLKQQTPEAALAIVAGRIPWHARRMAILGIEFPRIRLLQWSPCVLLALLSLVSLRMLRAATRRDASANPGSAGAWVHRKLREGAAVSASLIATVAAFALEKLRALRDFLRAKYGRR